MTRRSSRQPKTPVGGGKIVPNPLSSARDESEVLNESLFQSPDSGDETANDFLVPPSDNLEEEAVVPESSSEAESLRVIDSVTPENGKVLLHVVTKLLKYLLFFFRINQPCGIPSAD